MLSNMLPVFGNGVEMTSYPLDNVSGSELLYTYELKIKGDILEIEWEAYVSQFQGCDPNAKSTEKWQMMELIFDSNN